MIIELQEGDRATDLDLRNWGIALYGETLDDRGLAAVDEIKRRSDKAFMLHYLPEELAIVFNHDRINVDAFSDKLRSVVKDSVVLEATTLGFVEILLCCQALYKVGSICQMDIVYVEPEHYRRSPRRRHLLHQRDFELSNEVPGYRGIPGSAILLGDRSSQKGVFLLGYEEARLRRAFEDLQMIDPSRTDVVVGVPAFRPGWEMDSIANNITVIREQHIRGGVYFCGAENPAAVIDLLTNIYRGLSDGERLFVAPIGTKPHGVGAALFVSQHPKVGVLYDHPQRTKGRSNRLGHWHLYTIRG